MTDKSELHERAIVRAIRSLHDQFVLNDVEARRMATLSIDAYIAIAPQAPVSAVPVCWLCNGSGDGWKEVDKITFDSVLAEQRLSSPRWKVTQLYSSPPPPAQADDGKDAEIGYLKLEMDGVDNAKEEIGRLLGLTEEFRWKRISAAIHEQKRLIRELVVALTEFLEFGEYAYSHGREALAKAKAAGYSNEGKDNG